MMAARLGNADLVLDLHRAGANVGYITMPSDLAFASSERCIVFLTLLCGSVCRPDNVDVWGRSCADYFILGVCSQSVILCNLLARTDNGDVAVDLTHWEHPFMFPNDCSLFRSA